MPKDCDMSKGDLQCPATLCTVSDERLVYLNCRYVAGHEGKHKTSYIDGQEWEQDVTGLKPIHDDR